MRELSALVRAAFAECKERNEIEEDREKASLSCSSEFMDMLTLSMLDCGRCAGVGVWLCSPLFIVMEDMDYRFYLLETILLIAVVVIQSSGDLVCDL